MYFLSKFCRICVQTDVKLLDLDTLDFDEVKLSEKLETCTKMVITRESVSSEICMQCIAKLRVSYQFLNMCKKSTKTLQDYLTALICEKDERTKDHFVNTELSVVVTPIKEYTNFYNSSNSCGEYVDSELFHHREKRKRITKEQRCSLLKRLLIPAENQTKISSEQQCFNRKKASLDSLKGGLKNIINFTRNYEFGVKLDKNSNYEATPLAQLKAFSSEFFKKDFTAFRNTILYIIENKDNLYDSGDSDDEGIFHTLEDEEDSKENIVKFEEIIVEPDIKIKTEMEFEDEGECAYNYLKCVNPIIDCRSDVKEDVKNEIPPLLVDSHCSVTTELGSFREYQECVDSSNNSMQFLNNFVGSYQHRRTFSPNNVRCRTRDNPYINPMLRHQFLYRSFRCHKCSRYFKSPGYLKAHCSKVH